MRFSNRWSVGLGLCAVLAMFSCSGSKGDTGPAGPTGPTGTANVIYSTWKPVVAAWGDTTIDGSRNKTSFVLAPEVTQAVLDGGLVMVYFKFSTEVLPLPFTSYAGGRVSTIWFRPVIETTEPIGYTPLAGGTAVTAGAAIPTAQQNRIRLYRFTHDNTDPILGVTSGGQFRYIIIPGGTTAVPMVPLPDGTTRPLDLTDYEAVKQHLGLLD